MLADSYCAGSCGITNTNPALETDRKIHTVDARGDVVNHTKFGGNVGGKVMSIQGEGDGDDDSGILDGAVSIDKYTPQELTKKEMQEGKTC